MVQKMSAVKHILLSNDDGVYAKGLQILADTLQPYVQLSVIAPDRNHSGASNSLTLTRPLRVRTLDNGFKSVDGTPTDCVHIALTGSDILDISPDLIISGINEGANLGDDTLYSGTVAAAMEGRFAGFPAIAVSLAGKRCKHYETAANVILTLVKQLQVTPLSKHMLLNINVPDIPYGQLKGFDVTRLGSRHCAEPTIMRQDPRGEPIYWIGPPGLEEDAGPGTDFYAIADNKVSITPLKVDLTDFKGFESVATWLQEMPYDLNNKG